MKAKWLTIGIAMVLAAGGVVWIVSQRPPRLVYDPRGYGGFQPAPRASDAKQAPQAPLDRAKAAYNAGDYAGAEREALNIVRETKSSKDAPTRAKAAEAAGYVRPRVSCGTPAQSGPPAWPGGFAEMTTP